MKISKLLFHAGLGFVLALSLLLAGCNRGTESNGVTSTPPASPANISTPVATQPNISTPPANVSTPENVVRQIDCSMTRNTYFYSETVVWTLHVSDSGAIIEGSVGKMHLGISNQSEFWRGDQPGPDDPLEVKCSITKYPTAGEWLEVEVSGAGTYRQQIH